MLKAITQTRVLQTAEKLETLTIKSGRKRGEVVAALAVRGLNGLAGIDSESDDRKLEFELAYHEVKANPAALKTLLIQWQHHLERWRKRSTWLNRIQSNHQISGLVPTLRQLGTHEITYLWQHPLLNLIEDDLPHLRSQKALVFRMCLDYAIYHSLQFWVQRSFEHYQDWQPIEVSEMRTALSFYDWLDFWESIYYFSPSKMQQEGQDQIRDTSDLSDDIQHHEVHLHFGNGLQIDSARSSIWFCAANHKPCL
ncbi:hypothetical protein ACQ4M3_29215 [Leptolyngbya sp. AN03gr2]|uniref:hypothetical protein n=1 Tax=unclassified Leptolyngbya TaxID=2650499 RepID=UPI003D30EF68